jgi:hypothetical protein
MGARSRLLTEAATIAIPARWRAMQVRLAG